MWNIAIQSCWQLVVITHELIYGVRAVYLSGKNHCERGLLVFVPNRRQPGAVPCQTGLGANVPWFVGLTLAVLNRWTQNVIIWGKDSSVHENHRTCQTFPMARPKEWEISQILIEYIKPIEQMSDEPWKFFSYTETQEIHLLHKICLCKIFPLQQFSPKTKEWAS